MTQHARARITVEAHALGRCASRLGLGVDGTAIRVPPPAHLPLLPASRASAHGCAFRLSESSAPTHDGSPESTLAIIRWLGVETHERWRPSGGLTFCNVYASDLCHLLGAYLPRVWWVPAALAAHARGESPSAVYTATVRELSANALFRWLEQWGASYGWRRCTLEEAQYAANAGRAAVICARRVVESAPGHISVVVPESDRCEAVRDVAGIVTIPVQSQAGGRNVEIGTGRTWWLVGGMAEWGAWRHDPLHLADTEPAPPPSVVPTLEAHAPSESVTLEAFLPTLADKDPA